MEDELLCPACRVPLLEMRTELGVLWRCQQCDGRAVALNLLRRIFAPASINALWLHAIHSEGRPARPCPSCGNPMFEVLLHDASAVAVEACRICEFVWFDKDETRSLEARL